MANRMVGASRGGGEEGGAGGRTHAPRERTRCDRRLLRIRRPQRLVRTLILSRTPDNTARALLQMGLFRVWVAELAATLIIIASIAHGAVPAEETCKLTPYCIEAYALTGLKIPDTLVVPRNVVALSESLCHYPGVYVLEDSYCGRLQPAGDTLVSVMLVIDHSAAMGLCDSTSSRYSLASRLIDRIASSSPLSEIGIVVFSNQLMFNFQDDSFFTQLDSASGWHDSYVPLTQLNSQAAVEKLKWSIELSAVEKDSGGNRKLLHADYSSTGRHDGHFPGANPGDGPAYAGPDLSGVQPGYNGACDISLAFDAARKALASARNVKKHVVFLSGGSAGFIDYERQAPTDHTDDYVQGSGIPHTVTALYGPVSQPIPTQIKTMTASISANTGTPTEFRCSDAWKALGGESLLLEQMYNGLGLWCFHHLSPVSMTVNGVDAQGFDSATAFFPAPFPLTGDFTTFSGTFTDHWPTPSCNDVTQPFSFVIARRDTSWLPPGVSLSCQKSGVSTKPRRSQAPPNITIVNRGSYVTVSTPHAGTISLYSFVTVR